MPERRNRPILIRRVNLLWYPLALVPILALGYLSLGGFLPALVAPLVLFALFFWIFSFVFAIAGKLTKPREPRQ
ncbi:MAG: hypothetical protein J0I99_09375 [Devosia sp.]|uniref:hypothetical protein n=1 Tax=Devosia sp. TaxID=1871048 RepID=UPI001AC434D3|nr:hypothetical protein [Devosia sp.]MBN9315936.1 hypothetical protein [Devosia sp.]